MLNLIKKLFCKEKTNVSAGEINENKAPISIFYALDGETERKLGNYKKSVECMTKAIEIEPDNDMYYITRALSYIELTNYYAALDDLNKALDLNPNIENTKNIKAKVNLLLSK